MFFPPLSLSIVVMPFFISKQTDIIGWVGFFAFFDTNDIFYNYYLFD